MSSYHIPRQPTTRLEFLPGIGLRELGAIAAGLGIGYLLYKVLGMVGVGEGAQMVFMGLPAIASFMFVQGGESSLMTTVMRMHIYNNSARRLFYQVGSAGTKAAPASAKPQEGLVSNAMAALGLSKKNQPSMSQLPKTVQEWLPVYDVAGGLIQRRDGSLVAAIGVQPVNINLKSPNEQRMIIGALHEAINALQHPAQIISIPRPLDLDDYVRSLDSRMRELDPARQRLMRPYIRYVSGMVAGGEAQERRYYVLLPQTGNRTAAGELLQRANDLVARLHQAGLTAHHLDDPELLDLLRVWSHPMQAAFEGPPGGAPSVTTLMED